MVPKLGLDECNWHYLFSILVEFSIQRSFLGTLNLTQGSVLFLNLIGAKNEEVKIPTLLDESKLDLPTSLFKIAMQSNHVVALEPPLLCNRIHLALDYTSIQ